MPFTNYLFCSAIELSKVVNATISGLKTGTELNISGIFIIKCSNVNISWSTFYSKITLLPFVITRSGVGIAICGSINESVHTRNVMTGVAMYNVSNVTVQDSQFQRSVYNCGILNQYLVIEPDVKL